MKASESLSTHQRPTLPHAAPRTLPPAQLTELSPQETTVVAGGTALCPQLETYPESITALKQDKYVLIRPPQYPIAPADFTPRVFPGYSQYVGL